MRVALAAFALIVVAGPLLFGAVDRISQIFLILLLIIGILAQPPAVVPLSTWGNRLVIAFLALLIFKEFAPAEWFGATAWRTILQQEFSLELPPTHDPEPARAIDALLAGAIAAVWFLWVRRLAAERENRPLLAWSLFIAAAIVAAVSFATRNPDSQAIFGVRNTAGWKGFGTFPNRNHSADFFAMGAVIGCGCVTWAAARKSWLLALAGVAALVLDIVALLTTESRGGLLAFGAGLLIFLLLVLLKVRSRKAVAAALGAALVCGAMALAFGAEVFARFHSDQGGTVSNAMRIRIWQDAAAMWRDAPLLGHGLDSFAQIFPLYQTLELENQVVLHPESSWLQWLAELGAIPLLIAVVALALFARGHLREAFTRGRSFFLRAAGFGAVAALLSHSFIDVPAHRWGTAGFALAALAIACPLRLGARSAIESRQAALVPLGVAIAWALPFLFDFAAWSPLQLSRLLTRNAAGGDVRLSEMENALRFFPLNPQLHQSIAVRQLALFGRSAPASWQQHFAVAARLLPGSWPVLAAQARVVEPIAPSLAQMYWRRAIARGGAHREEVFREAVAETRGTPVADAMWGHFVEENPRLLLAYVPLIPATAGAYYFSQWWKERGLASDLDHFEVESFYRLAPRFGSAAQLEEFMQRHAAWRNADYAKWAALLHEWGEDERAWKILAAHSREPAFPNAAPPLSRDQLASKWRLSPSNFVNAQQLALAYALAGETAQSDEVIVRAAADETAPPWFVQKGAHILVRNGRFDEAVALLLRKPAAGN